MEYNFQIRLNEAVNLWNHFLAHFDSEDLASIYNPEYLKKIKVFGKNYLNSKTQVIKPMLIKYYQKLCFLPYIGLDTVEKLFDFLSDENQFLGFISGVQVNYEPDEVRKLGPLIGGIIKKEYQKFYKNYWQNNLNNFKERQKLIVEEITKIYPQALLYFSRVNPEIRPGVIEIYLVEALGERGKGLGIKGVVIGLPEQKKDVLDKLLTGLHELAHAFSDPLFEKMGYFVSGAPTEENLAHIQRETAVNYMLEFFLKNSGAKITEPLTDQQLKIIPIEIKRQIELKIPWSNLQFYGIKTVPLGPSRNFVLLGKSLKWCPDFFVLEKKENYLLGYSPLVNRLYCLDSYYNSLIGKRELSEGEQRLLASCQLLVPADKKLEPKTPKSLAGSRLRVHLTSDCNLKCVYCYLSAGDKKNKTSKEVVKKLIERFLLPDQEKLYLEFHGGGEPTLEFETLKEIVEYVKGKIKIPVFYLQTNGVFQEEVLDFLIKNEFRISFSLDGPPAIQNKQRPASKNSKLVTELIEKNIKASIKAGLKVMSISIITAFNAPYLKEIFWYLYHLGIRRMMFNPISLLGRAERSSVLEAQPPDLHRFVKDFLAVIEIADEMGAILISDFLPKFLENHRPSEISCSACVPEINLSEEGLLVACTRTLAYGSNKDNPFIFGHYDFNEQNFLIDENKINNLRNRITQNMLKEDGTPDGCVSCLLKWDCSGDCLNELYLIKKDFYRIEPSRCKEKIFFARNYLRYRAGKEFIKILPCLKEEGKELFLLGYFNQFKLLKCETNEAWNYNPYLEIDIKKEDLKKLYQLIISYQKKIPYKPVLFLMSIKEDDFEAKEIALIESFIKALKQSGLFFKIVKPLSRVLKEDFAKNFNIPLNCYECLNLFKLKNEQVIFCNGDFGKKLEDYTNRDQIFNDFSGVNPDCPNLKI